MNYTTIYNLRGSVGGPAVVSTASHAGEVAFRGEGDTAGGVGVAGLEALDGLVDAHCRLSQAGTQDGADPNRAGGRGGSAGPGRDGLLLGEPLGVGALNGGVLGVLDAVGEGLELGLLLHGQAGPLDVLVEECLFLASEEAAHVNRPPRRRGRRGGAGPRTPRRPRRGGLRADAKFAHDPVPVGGAQRAEGVAGHHRRHPEAAGRNRAPARGHSGAGSQLRHPRAQVAAALLGRLPVLRALILRLQLLAVAFGVARLVTVPALGRQQHGAHHRAAAPVIGGARRRVLNEVAGELSLRFTAVEANFAEHFGVGGRHLSGYLLI